MLACFTLALGRARGTIDQAAEARLAKALIEVPAQVTKMLDQAPHIAHLASVIAEARDVLYLGRGLSYPLALEGALKLKEISYIHAEGYAAGEMKHGPIALIDEHVPVIKPARWSTIGRPRRFSARCPKCRSRALDRGVGRRPDSQEFMTISFELHRRWDARAYDTQETTPRDSHGFVLEWRADPQPVDAEVPAIIAQTIVRALTELGRVGFRWSGEPAWPESDAAIIAPPERSVARRIADKLATSWPTAVVVTAAPAVAAQVFQHDWDTQGQLALVIDPAGGDDGPALAAL